MKTEALKLADELLRDNTQLTVKSAYMIRRLVEELDKLKDMLAKHQDIIADWDKKPLSDEEILAVAVGELDCVDEEHIKRFARAIEERHGIK